MRQLTPRTKIMIFGTFDIVHPGHEHFFMQARKLAKNPFLIVSIARDVNVKRIKGKLPKNSELKRKRAVEENPLVDKAVLSGIKKYLPHIQKEQPDIIALGYDQTEYTKTLKKDLLLLGLTPKIVTLRPHRPDKYKTSLLLTNHH